MDIEEAFTQKAIEDADAALDTKTEKEVRAVLQGLVTRTAEDNEEWEHIAVFAFMAGRAYQADQPMAIPPVEITMDTETVSQFIQFLVYKMEVES